MSRKKNFHPAWLLIGVVVTVLVGLGIFLWINLNGSNENSLTALATDTVKQGDLTKTIYGEGKISSNKTSTVYADESGTVISTRLKGTVVNDDDFVARIEVPDGDTSFVHYPLAGADGYISEMLVSAGDRVMADQTAIAKISSKKNLSIKVNLIAGEALQVKAGQTVKVAIPSLNKTINGEVSHLSKVPNSDGTYTATVKINTSELGKNPLLDLDVTVEITVSKQTNQIYIDRAYLQTDGMGQKYVLLVDEDGNTTQKNVTTGFSNDTYIAITEGLSAGQTIGLASLNIDSNSQTNGRGGVFQMGGPARIVTKGG